MGLRRARVVLRCYVRHVLICRGTYKCKWCVGESKVGHSCANNCTVLHSRRHGSFGFGAVGNFPTNMFCYTCVDVQKRRSCLHRKRFLPASYSCIYYIIYRAVRCTAPWCATWCQARGCCDPRSSKRKISQAQEGINFQIGLGVDCGLEGY